MFWFDIGLRDYSDTTAWTRPIPGDGLYQLVDENEVSAMLWRLSGGASGLHGPLDAALATTRMTVPPFERGYTRHFWNVVACSPVGLVDLFESAPFLADFLDALRCGGMSAAAVDAATEPTVHYPYPSSAPICR
jgi:hypothetical protein